MIELIINNPDRALTILGTLITVIIRLTGQENTKIGHVIKEVSPDIIGAFKKKDPQ